MRAIANEFVFNQAAWVVCKIKKNMALSSIFSLALLDRYYAKPEDSGAQQVNLVHRPSGTGMKTE